MKTQEQHAKKKPRNTMRKANKIEETDKEWRQQKQSAVVKDRTESNRSVPSKNSLMSSISFKPSSNTT